jgi:hypothetical protein
VGSAAEKAADGGKVDKGARQRALIGLIDDEPLLVAMSRSYSGPISQEASMPTDNW